MPLPALVGRGAEGNKTILSYKMMESGLLEVRQSLPEPLYRTSKEPCKLWEARLCYLFTVKPLRINMILGTWGGLESFSFHPGLQCVPSAVCFLLLAPQSTLEHFSRLRTST